jgi:hypothetical protein
VYGLPTGRLTCLLAVRFVVVSMWLVRAGAECSPHFMPGPQFRSIF